MGGYTPFSAIPYNFDNEFACDKPHYPFELPKGWCWCKLEDIASDLLYGTSEKSLSEGLVPVLRMGNINRIGEIDWNNLVYTSNQADIAKYSLKQDDLLFNRTNSAEWVGKTAIYKGNKNAIYAGYIIRIRTISVNADYINYVMNSSYHRAWCDEVKTDAVNQSNINAQKLSQFYIPIPPYKEQERIVNSVQRWTTFIDNIEKEKSNLAFSVTETKSKILDLAIHGKLVPQDPTDEPASELLKRINPKAEFTCDNPQYGKLPKGWCLTTFKGAFKDISSKPFQILQSQIKIKGKHPVISQSSNFIEGYSDEDVLYKCDTPIIIFGDHTRNVKYVDFDFIVGADGVKILKPYLDAKYGYFLILYAASHIVNKGYSRHFSQISKFDYIVPPLQEQYRIVAKIEELFTQLDKIEASL